MGRPAEAILADDTKTGPRVQAVLGDAADSGHHGVVEVPVRAKADLNKATTCRVPVQRVVPNMAGSPPLDAARLLGHTTVVVVQLLVGAGSSSGGAQQVAATVSGEGSALVTERAKRDP